jgi:NADPH:quinone reductase-like Zn-dependent oxidoreductase
MSSLLLEKHHFTGFEGILPSSYQSNKQTHLHMKNSAKSARVVMFREAGEPSVLNIETIEIPAPGPQEVRIQVKAMGINRADAMFRRAQYIEKPIFPARLGYEVAGIVESVGHEVNNIKIGDTVSVIPAFSLSQYATHGELAVVPAYAVEKHPSFLSFEEAASLWSVYLTAYGMLIDTAKIEAGQYVVINAASSGVGLAAIQTTNAAGAIPIAITTSKGKKDALVSAGAAHVITTADTDVTDEIKRITNGQGANVLLDAVGGSMLAQIIPAMAFRGKIYIYGTLSPEATAVPAMEILSKALTIAGFMVYDVNIDPVRQKAAKDFIYQGLNSGKLKPVIARVFAFNDFVEAHTYLESNQQVGKVIVTL